MKQTLKRFTSLLLAVVMLMGLLPQMTLPAKAEAYTPIESVLSPLCQEITVHPGQLVGDTGEIVESDTYGHVVGYELKKGHILTISNTDYVFSVRQLVDGDYSTMRKQATTDSFTATEDMTVGLLIRKPDKSALTAEELKSIVIYDNQYGMIGVEGYAQRFTVEAETIDGATATTRANIFLPKSYTAGGEPTKLIVMTNGHSAYLTDSVWNGNTAENVGIIRNYLNAGYAVWVVNNTKNHTGKTPDLGCPQLVDSYLKAYEYIQRNFNVEQKFSIHSRSFGTFAAMRLMQEVPELIKCAVMTGPRVSIKKEWPGLDKAFIATRFGFMDTTGGTYEADKLVGYDPYTDVDGDNYALPPTFWMLCEGDATAKPLEVIEKLAAHGNNVNQKTYTGTTHTGVCTLNSEEMFADALAFLDRYQTLEGKTISILGASISTYAGTSNGAAADTTNSTIRNNAKYYPHSVVTDVELTDTWWMQVAEDLNLRLLVNNSWSGSSLLHERGGTVGAYVDRCVQLHDDTGDNAGEMPDIIGIQMGTNDFQYYKDTLGTADIDYDALITDNGDNTYTYATPVTSLEAAAIVLHKISVRYPDAEVYYLNISQRVDGTDELIQSFNAELKQVVEHFGAHIVDVYNSGITMENFDTYIGDGRVHPNCLGMDAYTEAFKAALLAHTDYSVNTHTVSLDLTTASADYGTDKVVVDGDTFRVNLTTSVGNVLDVSVTMGGEDITADCYAAGSVTIDAVTADVTITAKGIHVPQNYRWEFDGTDLASISTGINVENTLTKNAGATADGVFDKTRYALESSVVLAHDKPWVVEWKCEGTWKNSGTSSGGRMFTSTDVNAEYNARYIFKSATNWILAMGEKTTTGSHNYGIALADHGIDGSAEHTYRLENRIADDGANMVWLYVDGVEIGAMNNYYVGTTNKNTTSDWLSGKDFVFPYMGTDTHGLTNCSIDYIQVWEDGVPSLAGKTISILGDSISTYDGVSNDASVNATLSGGAIYYTPGRWDVYREDTWWQQTADALGMEVLVNNSWSGSSVLHTRRGTEGAYVDRCVQLHNDKTGEEPDIIVVYMGGNDFNYYQDTLGTADIDYDTLITDNGNGVYTYAKPATTCEAYAIMLHKMKTRYPNAEIYCMTSTPRRDPDKEDDYPDLGQPTDFNAERKQIVAHFGCTVVDIENCGIVKDAEEFDKYIGDGRTHPNAEGMDLIAQALVRAILNSDAVLYDVTGTYTGTYTDNGAAAAVSGMNYTANLAAQSGYTNLDVTVTMGDTDVTGTVYSNGTIHIEKVTGDIVICAAADRNSLNFCWELEGGELVSTGDDMNALTKLTGTITDGVLDGARYQLTTDVVLKHDRPWVLEWKCAEDWRGVVLSSNPAQLAPGRCYISRTKGGQLCFGSWNGEQYNNYGVDLSGLNSQTHIYRLENRIAADGSNMVWLYVDGIEAGSMNNYFIGSNDQNTPSDWISGKDFEFSYIGSDSTTLNNCALDYIQVWEDGEQAESLPLRYDDHYDVTGKTVDIVDAGKPTSFQVGYGVAENSVLDTAVVTLEGDKLIATGIGTAKVRIDGQLYEVTVETAPISLLLLAGQSNMRGSEGNANQSIVCPDGMVYATYGDDRGADNTAMTVNNAAMFAPSALAGEYSTINSVGTTDCLSGYPVHSLTEAGAGKIGPDSGFAYEWVKSTGEKVWVINAAHGGTSISVWQPGTKEYEECQALFAACAETLRKEIAAGHFTLNHMGYFWCQGCADRTQSATWYGDKYLAMHEAFKTELAFDHDSDPSTTEKAFEFGGIIPVRVGNTAACYRDGVNSDTNPYAYHESFVDLRMSGPRVAQYWMGNNPELEDIWTVCTIGDDWVWMPDGTNGVSDYFNKHYTNGTVDYKPQVAQSASWYTPTTPKAVHDSIHYNQIGYNEIGRESVRNALIMLGEKEDYAEETTVRFVDWTGYKEVNEITASTTAGSGTLVVPIISPVTRAKSVTFSTSNGLKWNYGDLTADTAGTSGTLSADGLGVSVNVVKAQPGQHYADHLSTLPESYCANTDLWKLLEHDSQYYASGAYWGSHSSGQVYSVTIPVSAGDKIFATSFGKSGENGHASTSGIRTTFFNAYGIAKTMTPAETYAEFSANGGYLIAPEGTTAVNVAMWTNGDENELYILSAEHKYVGGICTICGAQHPALADWSGKIISILSASTSTFKGYIPVADGFNLTHRTRYPDTSRVPDVTSVDQTWWMQLITSLDAKLGINDSWAGSQVLNTLDANSGDLGPDAAMASMTRIQNLGANGSPDVILFFGAGNDMGRGVPLGSFDPATAPTTVDLTTIKWETLADAYVAAIMRLQHAYPDAQIVAVTTYAMPSYATAAKLDKYIPVLKAICDHYGVPTVDLRDSGVTFDMLPDNIHPNAEGMDLITEAVLHKLLNDIPVESGENVVYTVSHELDNAVASLGYYKGVSAGETFTETLTGDDLTATVTMGGVDITADVYKNGKIAIPEVTGDIVITARAAFNADGHLQQLPEDVCAGTNLWTALEPENIYYTVSGWGNTANGNSWSITFPVQAGDRIWATSLGAYPGNGSTANGVRVTWFDENGVLETVSRDVVYSEFSANGYLTAPEGAVALNLPMTGNEPNYAIYLLDRAHNYESAITVPTCTEQGYTTYTCECGDSYADDYTEAAEHTYKNGFCTFCSAKETNVITPPGSGLAVTVTPANYAVVSNVKAEKLACAPCFVSYGEGKFAVAYLADEVNTVESEGSTTISVRVALFESTNPQKLHYVDVAAAGQTIGDVTIGSKAPYEPNLIAYDDGTLLVIFNLRDTAGHYMYYSAMIDTETLEVTNYQPLTLDGKIWNPANIAASYHSYSGNSISAPTGSMVFTSQIILRDGFFYGYCGGISSGFAGMLVRSSDGVNWSTILAPEAVSEMAGVIECGFRFVGNTAYFCMRDISSGVYHCSYDLVSGKQLVKTEKLSELTTSKTATFLQNGKLYLIANKVTGDDSSVGRRNTAQIFEVNSESGNLTLVKQVFCADGIAYHSVVEYGGTNYWCFHTDARRINPYTQGRSNLALIEMPALAVACDENGVLQRDRLNGFVKSGCITAAVNQWQTGVVNLSYQLPITCFTGWDSVTVTANEENKCYMAFFCSEMKQAGDVAYAEGWTNQVILEPGETQTFRIPADATYLYILNNNAAGNDLFPAKVQFSTAAHTHSYTATVTPPACTEQGYTTYTCECGDSYVDDHVDASGHSYEATVTYPAGLTKGYTNYTCTSCADAYRTAWLDAAAYEGKTIACVGDSITCGVGVTKDETDYVTLLAKQLGMDYIRLGVSGTTLCTDGSRTCNISKLTEGNVNGADVVTIAMGINDFCAAAEGYYELGDINSTDSSTIYGAARMWCERIVELRKTDSLSHTQFYFVTPVITSWNNSVTSARDWDQSKENVHGYTLRDLCNAIIEVAALYDVPVIDLNLISGMYYNNADDNNVAAFGGDGVHPGVNGHAMMAGALANALLQNEMRDDHTHTYGSWVTTKYPGCEDGEEKRVCSVCTATESQVLNGTGHSYSSVVTDPTCTAQGYTTHTCAFCGDSYVDSYVDALGHTYINGICVVCGYQANESGLIHAIPENDGVKNAIDRAYALTDVLWTPLADVPGVHEINGEYFVIPFEAGVTYKGIPYSGVTANDCYVGLNVSLESFLTALENGNSVLYTENLNSTNPKSATYFGTVCSKFAQYVLDIPGSYNTNNVANIPGMETIAMPGTYTVDQIKLGDVVLNTATHTTVCTDILYDTDGNVAYIEIAEAVMPLVRRMLWSPEEFYEHFADYRLCRYQHIDEVPAANAVNVDGHYALMPRFGDKYNYRVSSTKGVVDVLDSGYYKAVTLRDGVIADEIILNGATSFSFDRNIPGYLEMYLEKEDGSRSSSVYACVVKSSVSVTDSSEFGLGKLTVNIDGNCGTPLYVQVGSAHAIFCNVEGCDGAVELAFSTSKISTQQVRVAYQNEYGIYLSSWVPFTAETNPSNDPLLSQGEYWNGYNITPNNPTPVIQENKEGYWSYTMVPVEENTLYYSEGATRMWFLDENGNGISTYNAYKDGEIPFQFTTPAKTAYVSVAYSPDLVEQGTETLKHVHRYQLAITAPTCTEQGYTTNTCHCGDSYVDDYVDATGHSYGEWYEVDAPTCTTEGEDRRDCDNCDHYETRTVNALGHNLTQHEAKEPTCMAAGWEAYETCSRCDYSTYEEVPATGHSHAAEVTPPTCTEQGYTTYTCHCGDSYVGDYMDELGHYHATADVLADGEQLTLTEHNVVKNYKSLIFSANVEDLGQGLIRLSHGQKSYSGNHIEITAEKVLVYSTYKQVTIKEYAHGLTINGNIHVRIDMSRSSTKLTISTSSGTFSKTISWSGSNGELACSVSGTTLTNVDLRWYALGIESDYWFFGDSWFSTTSASRWTKYLLDDGYTDVLLGAYGGMGASAGLKQFRELLRIDAPKYAVWALGMNNGDRGGVINSSWLAATEEFLSLCQEYGVTPILCTIPTTPNVNNRLKNEWVKNSGYRYIDFDLVLLENHTTGEWFEGTAASDLNHPTTLGAKMLYPQVFADFPELAMKDPATCSHVIYKLDARQADCTNGGRNTYYVCSHCGSAFADETCSTATTTAENLVAPLGHTEEIIPGYNATCTESGLTDGKKCSVCGKTLVEQEVIPALCHSEGETVVENEVEASCTEGGSYDNVVYCSVCGEELSRETIAVPSLGHTEETIPGYAASCTDTGLTDGKKCSVCDETIADQEVIPEKGHKYDGGVITMQPSEYETGVKTYTCGACGHTKTESVPALGHEHSYSATVTKPTCAEGGYTVYTCRCGDSYVDDYVDATGHGYGEWYEVDEPTCTTTGEDRRDCSNCDHYETRVVEALGHDLTQHEAKEPTCTAVGWEAYETCARCNHTTYAEIPAAGHNHMAEVTPPTCTEQGYTTYTCHCGDSYMDGYVDATGHNYGDWYTTTDPKCEVAGEERHDCVDCDHYETREVNALGHDLTQHEAKEPTCTVVGWEAYETCSRCDYTTYAEIPATGHNHATEVTPPTCTEQGYTTYTCHCGDSYVGDYVDATGHSYGEWYELDASTCTTEGEDRRDCGNCDHYETRTVNALGHDLTQHEGKEPTCTAVGWNAYETCSRCDHTTYAEIPATGHNHAAEVTPPTCTEQGYTTYTCHCGDSYVDDYVDATGHSYGEWDEVDEPTCTTTGEDRRDCGNCDHYETRMVDALGHDLTQHEAKEPTCTVVGWEAYETCSRCDYSTYEEVPATGHSHAAEVTPPTCTEQGYTTYTCHCGDRYVNDYVDATGHSYGEWYEVDAPTCTTEGEDRRDCGNCDHYETRIVDALGHDLTQHEAKEATCTVVGWEAYETCSRCAHTTYTEVLAIGHSFTNYISDDNATTSEDGTKTAHCDRMGCTETDTVIEQGSKLTVVSLAITCHPVKLLYIEGEDISVDGMIVTAIYSNDTIQNITGYMLSGYDKTELGVQEITVSYGGCSASFTVTVCPNVPSRITSALYKVLDGFIRKIPLGTTARELLEGVNETIYVKLYSESVEVPDTTVVGTGMIMSLMDGDTIKDSVTVVVTGDSNGDGKLTITDMLAVKAHLLNKGTLTGAYAEASDTNGDEKITITDFIQMKAHVLGKSSVAEN